MIGSERTGIQRGGVRKVERALDISLARAGEMDVLSHCSAMMVCGVRHMRRAPSRQSAISIILALMSNELTCFQIFGRRHRLGTMAQETSSFLASTCHGQEAGHLIEYLTIQRQTR